MELLAAIALDPENFALLLSTDLGCQIQWFTHSLFDGENSFGALFMLLETVMASFMASEFVPC